MTFNDRARVAQAAQLLFWLALIFAVVMALLPKPPHVAGNLGDKYQHMLAFGTLTVLACMGYPGAELLRLGEHLSFLGALIEVMQSIPALHRDCDIRDWIADTVVVVGVLLVVRMRRRHA
jgi:VanZ family protein